MNEDSLGKYAEMEREEQQRASITSGRAAQYGGPGAAPVCALAQDTQASGESMSGAQRNIVGSLAQLGAKFAPHTEEHALIKSAVRDLVDLRRELDCEREHTRQMSRIVSKHSEESAELQSRIVLARLALRT